MGKCELYVSPFSKDGDSISIGGTTLKASPHLNITGLQLHVKATTCAILAGLMGRARDVFWKNQKVLCAKTSLRDRIGVLEKVVAKVVAGAGLWCISAFYPQTSALHLVNTFQMQLIITMMGPRVGVMRGGSPSVRRLSGWPDGYCGKTVTVVGVRFGVNVIDCICAMR